jgi:hypothetical protein
MRRMGIQLIHSIQILPSSPAEMLESERSVDLVILPQEAQWEN